VLAGHLSVGSGAGAPDPDRVSAGGQRREGGDKAPRTTSGDVLGALALDLDRSPVGGDDRVIALQQVPRVFL